MQQLGNKLIVIILILSSTVFSQKNEFDKLNSYLNYVENNNLGVGSVSIFKDGKEVYNKKFGQKYLTNLVYDENTKYQIGSVTKLITATLVFKLFEENKLKLDDKLSNFYPEIPNSNKITIKNLLEHTSGLGSYVVKNGEIWVTEKVTEEEIYNLILKQGVTFEPNEKVAYSNTAYYLLTKILEKKYKKPFHKIVEKEIANPFNLKNLVSVKSNPNNIFAPFEFEGNKWHEKKEEINFKNVVGVGDLVSTSKDLNVFIYNLFQNNIVNKKSLDTMIPVENKESWGRGLAVWDFDGIIFYGHGGDTLGSHAVLIYNKKDNLSISFNTNAERVSKDDFIKYIVYCLYNKEFDFPTVD